MLNKSALLPSFLVLLSGLAVSSCGSSQQAESPQQGEGNGPSVDSETETLPVAPTFTFSAGASPKVMIVGDSISAGPGCYKGFLLEQLAQNNYTDFEFVGEYTDDCGGGVMHSAVSCSTAGQYTQASFELPDCFAGQTFSGMASLMASHQPDMVLLQLGVNDVWNGRAVDLILGDYEKLVAQAREQNPNIVLVVAQIQQMRPDCEAGDVAIFERAESLVEAVPAWALGMSTAESPVFVADLWTNSDWTMTETEDCVHPNVVGAERMGENWFNAIRGILNSAVVEP